MINPFTWGEIDKDNQEFGRISMFWHGESMIDHKIAVVIVGLPCALVIYYPMIQFIGKAWVFKS